MSTNSIFLERLYQWIFRNIEGSIPPFTERFQWYLKRNNSIINGFHHYVNSRVWQKEIPLKNYLPLKSYLPLAEFNADSQVQLKGVEYMSNDEKQNQITVPLKQPRRNISQC